MSEASPSIFISYCPSDSAYADKLKEDLEAQGLSVGMTALRTSRLESKIEGQVRECKAYVLVMTARSQVYEAVNAELTLARSLDKPILPILREGDPWPALAALRHLDLEARQGEVPTEQLLERLRPYLPDAAAESESSVEPESFVEPESSAEPELSAETEPSVEPEPLVESEPSVEPGAAAESESSAESEPSVEPESFVEPESSAEPGLSVEPDAATDAQPSVEPESPVETESPIVSESVELDAKQTTYPARRKVLRWAALTGGGIVLAGALGQFLKGREPLETVGEGDNPEPDNASGTGTEVGSDEGDRIPATEDDGEIKVGLLHSLSGSMAISETALVDAEELAIEEINAAGGILGKQIVSIVEDSASDWPTFTEKAEKLIELNNVDVVFGCWTSASRKAVLSVFEKRDHMLWYPLAYEGQECSKNVFYTGAVPNQQIEPAVDWLLDNEKDKAFFLLGADDVFPRGVSDIIQAQLKEKGGEMAGEAYVPFGGEVTKLISDIQKAMPEGGVIFNSLSGDDNVAFFRQLQREGMGPEKYPVMCVSMAEAEIRQIGPEFLVGHYAAWTYFQTVEGEANEAWVTAFKENYGRDRVTDAPMASAYTAVYLWKQAVEAAGTTEISAVRKAAYGQTFEAPGGTVTLQPNHHLSQTARIGKVREDGLFEIVWTSEEPVEPSPWNQYVADTKGYQCDWSDATKGSQYRIQE